MTKITITKPDLNIVKGVSAKNGKPYELRIQTGYLHSIDADGVAGEIPDKFEFILGDGENAYPRGNYLLAPSALFVGRDGRLSVNTRLVPITTPAK
jgi:hypothetical protein